MSPLGPRFPVPSGADALPAWERPEWWPRAACRGTMRPGVALHFAARRPGEVPDPPDMAQAKAMCARCPVRLECLAYGRSVSPRFGIFGGLTPEERQGRKR